MVTLGRSAHISQQPQRALRLLIGAWCVCVACSVSSCATPADSAATNSAASQGLDKTGSGVAVPPASSGVSAPQEAAPVSPGVGSRDTAPQTSFDSSRPVRATGGREETVVVSAPKPQPAAPTAPDATVVEAPEPPPVKPPTAVPSAQPAVPQPAGTAAGGPQPGTSDASNRASGIHRSGLRQVDMQRSAGHSERRSGVRWITAGPSPNHVRHGRVGRADSTRRAQHPESGAAEQASGSPTRLHGYLAVDGIRSSS